jgi:hypothetical protein
MLVDVIAMKVMQMAIVQIVRMTVVSDRRVTAGRSVRVRVAVVLLTLLSHAVNPFAGAGPSGADPSYSIPRQSSRHDAN